MIKRKVLKVIKDDKPSQYLIDKLFKEEQFDFIRDNINKAKSGKKGKDPEKRRKKKERKQKRRDEEAEILKKYTNEEMLTFSKYPSKLKKRNLPNHEYLIVRRFSKRLKKNKRSKRKKRQVRENKRSTYETYINSKAWENRKNRYWQLYPRRCAICDTVKRIHLHHMSYNKLRNEPDEHLIPLCQEHHEQYHRDYGVKRNMIRPTKYFIAKEREKITKNI